MKSRTHRGRKNWVRVEKRVEGVFDFQRSDTELTRPAPVSPIRNKEAPGFVQPGQAALEGVIYVWQI